MRLRTYLFASLLAIPAARANPISYTFTAPAITTGPIQTVAFSLSFTAPQLITSQTDLLTLGTLSIPNSFDPGHPNLISAGYYPATYYLPIEFSSSVNNANNIWFGYMLGGVPFNAPGSYFVNWQVTSSQVAGNSVTGLFTITDLGVSTGTPEPSSVVFVVIGLGLACVRKRKHL